jgi:hypothetical protein
MKNPIVTTKKNEVVTESTEMQSAILQIVKQKDIDPERLEKFLNLQVQLEDRQNAQAFNEAFAEFQKECPIIQKTKKVSYGQTNYDYASLDEMVHQIKPIMGKNGLGFSFDITQADNLMNLVTTITHKDGHSKTFNYFFDQMDSGGKMNDSQRRKSALTYAKRSALENALGIVTAGEDDDARRAVDNPVTNEQLEKIHSLMKTTDTTEESLLKYLKIENLGLLSTVDAKKTINSLNGKRTALMAKEGKNV